LDLSLVGHVSPALEIYVASTQYTMVDSDVNKVDVTVTTLRAIRPNASRGDPNY